MYSNFLIGFFAKRGDWVKKNRKTTMVVLFLGFILYWNMFFSIQVFAQEQVSKEATFFLTHINQYRTKTGIPPLEWNENLYRGAENHVTYMQYHKVFQQQQQKYKQYFTGAYPWNRAAYFRYKHPMVVEFIGKDKEISIKRLDSFIENPYDRIFWLSPEYMHMVFAYKNEYSSFLLGGEKVKEDQVVVYPGEQQKEVPTLWVDEKGQKSNGYPITLAYYSTKTIETVEVIQVQMKDQLTGRFIDTRIEAPKTNPYLVNGIVIIPTSELQHDRTYQVQAMVKVVFNRQDFKVIKKNWIFSTIPVNDSKMKDTIGHWSEEIVHNFYKKGIVEPRQNTFFYPDQSISRQEFAKMIAKAFHLPDPKRKQTIFKDVSKNNPYEKYIHMVQEQEFMQGSEYLFQPLHSLTREEGVVIVMRIYEQLKNTKKITSIRIQKNVPSFSDMRKVSPWAQGSIIEAQKIGIIQGRQNNEFQPKAAMTRAEAATLLYRLLERTE